MNDLNDLTEQELNAVSGGARSVVVVTKVQEVKPGAQSSIQVHWTARLTRLGPVLIFKQFDSSLPQNRRLQ